MLKRSFVCVGSINTGARHIESSTDNLAQRRGDMSEIKIGALKFRKKDECGNGRYSDGYILPDSFWGKEFGFTSDKFEGYLWKEGHWVIISQIESLNPCKGNFKRLVRSIKDFVFDVAVPTPMRQMEEILKRWGWKPIQVVDKTFGTVELWIEPGKKYGPPL